MEHSFWKDKSIERYKQKESRRLDGAKERERGRGRRAPTSVIHPSYQEV